MSNCQDINVLESVNKAIGPLQEFTDVLSVENYVSVSYLKPVKKTVQPQPPAARGRSRSQRKSRVPPLQYLNYKYEDPATVGTP